MAYPIIPAPYGFKPVSEVGGLPYAGSTRMIPIASGYNTNLFNGDIVQLSGGTIVATAQTVSNAATAQAGTIGIFLGVEYTVPATSQRIRAQYWPAGTVAQDAVAYVVDDPRAVFKAAVTTQSTSLANTGTSIGYLSGNFVGTNVYAVTGATGNVSTGDSAMSVSGGVITSGTAGNTRVATLLPFRVLQLVPDTASVVTAVASTSGSNTAVTLTAANTAISPGMQLVVALNTSGVVGAFAGNYITVTNVNGTAVTVNSAITLPAGTAVSFIGYPEVLVTWNQTFHSYTNTAGV